MSNLVATHGGEVFDSSLQTPLGQRDGSLVSALWAGVELEALTASL